MNPHSNNVILNIEQLTFSYDSQPIIQDLNLSIVRGEFFSIIGPSGCGKSTLLQLIAGLLKPTSGTLQCKTERLAYVFQTSVLLPWKTVLQNVMFSLECQGVDNNSATQQASTILQTIGLGEHLGHFPRQLSEGMKQRVNIARALVTKPDILLMDEPFAALDVETRRTLQQTLIRLWRTFQCTILFVSHDLEEVVTLSDRVAFLSNPPASIDHSCTIDLQRPRKDRIAVIKLVEQLQDYFVLEKNLSATNHD